MVLFGPLGGDDDVESPVNMSVVGFSDESEGIDCGVPDDAAVVGILFLEDVVAVVVVVVVVDVEFVSSFLEMDDLDAAVVVADVFE